MTYVTTWYNISVYSGDCPDWLEQIGYRCEKVEDKKKWVILDFSIN